MNLLSLLLPVFVDLNWSEIFKPLYEMFMGNETSGMTGIIGNEFLLGGFIFLILLLLTLMFGLGMLIGAVVIIPSLFAVFNFIPDLRIIVAIILGLVIGIGLHHLIKR